MVGRQVAVLTLQGGVELHPENSRCFLFCIRPLTRDNPFEKLVGKGKGKGGI